MNKLEQYKQLMRKGFKSPEQVRIQEADVARTKLQYESALMELKVKENYEYKRKTTEFSSKADQAKKKVEQAQATLKAQLSKAISEWEAAKGTADIEQQQFKEFLKQKDKTIIRAGQDGIVAYANEVVVRLEPPDPRGSDRLLDAEDLQPARHDQNAGEGQHPRVADQEDQGGPEGRDPRRVVSQHRLRRDGQVGLATCRLDAPVDDRRREAISHGRRASTTCWARSSSPA